MLALEHIAIVLPYEAMFCLCVIALVTTSDLPIAFVFAGDTDRSEVHC